jgi:hypothetical protein
MICAESCFAKRDRLARERLGPREMATRVLDSAQVVIQRRNCWVVRIETPPSNSKSAKVRTRTVRKTSAMFTDHPKSVEEPESHHAIGSGAAFREVERCSRESLRVIVLAGSPRVLASGCEPKNANREQRPEHAILV